MATRRALLWEGFQLAIIAAMFITVAIRWNSVPDRIPIHWSASGEVDGYGGRFMGLLLVPLMSVGLYFLLLLIPRIDPSRANYAGFRGAYLAIRAGLMVYLAVLFAVMNVAIENSDAVPMDRIIIACVAALFVLLGAAMSRIRPNYFVGIRTPWTLASQKSWAATHRAGGWVFGAAGVAAAVGAIFGGVVAFIVMFATLIPGLVGLVAYSYWVWKNDSERVPAQVTVPELRKGGPDA